MVEATRRQKSGIQFTGVVYAHPLHVTIGVCMRDLERIAKVANIEELANRVQSLPICEGINNHPRILA
jgi:hypothetical protein